ncbi:MAG: CPBP family intramembrane glutamic endopeptidase [Myxococcota bacterium]|nr:CPBP family intramembrane glutamic endopeptidase [Myxococcota bacterium]
MSESTPPVLDPARFVRFGVLFYGAMALVAVLWRVGLYDEPIWLAASAPSGVAWWAQAGLGLGVAAAVVLVSCGLSELTGWGRRLARAMAEPLRGLGVPDALLLAAASGLAEEMFFRGALQPRVGLVVASALFGVLHFAPRRELLPWTVFAVVMGFVLGWLFAWTGSLLAPVIAHTVINAVNLPLLVRRYGDASAGG